MTFTIEALAGWHDRSQFACGVEALDRYIRQQASADARRRVAPVFVARTGKGNEVAGFYTLSAGSIERETLAPEVAKRLPRYPVPVALIGRLAVDRRWSGQGLGSSLVADAFRRVVRASETLAVYAIVVDAKIERATRFCERRGFIRLPQSERRLFFPTSAVERLIAN